MRKKEGILWVIQWELKRPVQNGGIRNPLSANGAEMALFPQHGMLKAARGIFQKMLNVRVKSKTQHRVRKISFENKTEEEGEHL